MQEKNKLFYFKRLFYDNRDNLRGNQRPAPLKEYF